MGDWLRKCGEIDIKTLAVANWKLTLEEKLNSRRKAWLLFMVNYWNIDLILLSFFAYQSLLDYLPHFPKKVATD